MENQQESIVYWLPSNTIKAKLNYAILLANQLASQSATCQRAGRKSASELDSNGILPISRYLAARQQLASRSATSSLAGRRPAANRSATRFELSRHVEIARTWIASRIVRDRQNSIAVQLASRSATSSLADLLASWTVMENAILPISRYPARQQVCYQLGSRSQTSSRTSSLVRQQDSVMEFGF